MKRSVENGFFSYSYLTTDPLLDAVRNEPEFLRLLNVARTRYEAFRKDLF
jgi:hypothetical protein